MDSLNPLKNSGFNPLSFLGGSAGAGGATGLEGPDPMQLLLSLFGNPAAAQQGQQDQGQVCSCGGGASEAGGACNCGCNCCQKNQALGF